MNKTLKKWSLWACGVFMVGCLVGAIAAIATPLNAGVTATAETKYEVNSLTYLSGSASEINAYPNTGENKPNVGSWEHIYTVKEGTGIGVTLNGEVLPNSVIKFPHDFYIGLGKDAEAGDVLIIDGTFYNEKTDTYFPFNDCALQYNGSAWETRTAVALGSVTASGDADTLTLTSEKTLTSGKTLTLVKGGVSVNEENANSRVTSITTTENGITLEANMEDSIADIVFIRGVYTDGSTYYAISDSYFIWEASNWRTLVGYDTIISKASPLNHPAQTASGFYMQLDSASGLNDIVIPCKNGHGLKLNGKEIANGVIKLYSDLCYVDLVTPASVGDVLTINGFYQHDNGYKILFSPTQALQWNGSVWEALSHTTYDFDAMKVANESSQVGGENTKSTCLYITRVDGGWVPVSSWAYEFTYESGANVKKNGNVIHYTMKSVGSNVFLEFDSVNAGDVVSIGGTFVCASQDVRYAIKESYFKWDGSSWDVGGAYVKTELDTAEVSDENNGRNGFFVDMPQNVGVTSWSDVLTLKTGNGFMLNGEAVSGAYIKPIGTQLYVDVENMPVHSGDVLTVEGTYTCTVDGVTAEIVFNNTMTLKWNGMMWVTDTAKTYTIGTLVLHVNSSVGGASGLNNVLYLQRADGEALPVLSWDYVFTYESGDGFRVNDEQQTPSVMKSTGDGFYLAFDALSTGDVASFGGSFLCETLGVRYVVKESYFDWNGSGWENDVVYTAQHTVSHLQPTAPSTNAGANAAQVYLKINGSGSLPVQTWDYLFALRTGNGLKVNGEKKPIYEMKSTGDGLWLRFDAVSAGDVVSLSGMFVCKSLQTKYVIVESTFKYDGSKWCPVMSYNDEDLEFYDTVTNVDFGWGLEKTLAGTGINLSETTYTKSDDNTTGSIKLRFNYTSTDVANDSISIRLMQEDVWGNVIHVRIIWSGIEYVDEGKVFEFKNDTAYLIEIGAIKIKNSDNVWTYIKVDDILMATKTIASTGTANVNKVSIYAEAIGETAVWGDPDHVSVRYDGGETEYVAKGSEYHLPAENTSDSTFIGWLENVNVYQAGETIDIGENNLFFTTFTLDFALKDGAAIRLSSTADDSGIRFTTMINAQQFDYVNKVLTGSDVKVLEFGTLIMPNDYLSNNQAPNLTDFVAGSTLLKIPSTYQETVGNYVQYYGAMKKIRTNNYARDFAGRAYMVIEYANGMTKTLYTPFTAKNVRSIRTVAQAFKADDSTPVGNEIRYNALSNTLKAIVDAYATSPDYAPKTKSAATTVSKSQEGYAAAYVYANKEYQA